MPSSGENGAGKSTLMNILAGLYRPDAGEVRGGGSAGSFGSPRDAIAAGLGMVHQHFTLVPSQTVTENILLGLDGRASSSTWAGREAEVAALAERFGMTIDPRRASGSCRWASSSGSRSSRCSTAARAS